MTHPTAGRHGWTYRHRKLAATLVGIVGVAIAFALIVLR